jgi:hypothetical protein
MIPFVGQFTLARRAACYSLEGISMSTLDHHLETVTGERPLGITDAAANLIEKWVYRPEDRDAKPSKRNTHL